MPSSNPYSAPNLLGNGTPTATPLPGSPTLTPIPTNTFSSLFTATHTLTPVFSPTHTFTAVDTATPTTQATLTPTQSMTPTQTNTATNTMTNSDTPTSSFTAVNTNTWTITDTPLPTNTATPTATPTVTSTSTTTSTATPTCAGAGGTYQSASALNGAWGDVNVIDCRPITVVGLIKVTEFVLTGYNAASVPITENIGIYSDSGGYPATLIAAGSGPVTAGALTPIIAFGSPVPLTTGVYWLAADSDNNIGGQVVLPGFGISLNMNYTDGGVSGTDPTGNPIAMPGTLGGAVNQYEPCIAAEWVCP